MFIFVSYYLCYPEIYFIRYNKYGYTCLSVHAIHLENHLSLWVYLYLCSLGASPEGYSVPFYRRMQSIYFFQGDCWYMRISYSQFIFCFQVVLCLHWFFFFVLLSVAFVWWYSIHLSFVFSFYKSCISVCVCVCVVTIKFVKFHIYSSSFPFECVWSPPSFANSYHYQLPFYVFVAINCFCLYSFLMILLLVFWSFFSLFHVEFSSLSIFCSGAFLVINSFSFYMSGKVFISVLYCWVYYSWLVISPFQ